LLMIEAPSPMLIAVGMYLPLETTSAIFLGGGMKWAADRWAARRKLSADARLKFEEKGTLLASGLIAGESVAAIVLAALFPKGGSLTHFFTGLEELPFLAGYGGWISLFAFAIIAYALIRLPLRGRSG